MTNTTTALQALIDDVLEDAIGDSGGAWMDGEFRIEGRGLMNLLREVAARAALAALAPALDAPADLPPLPPSFNDSTPVAWGYDTPCDAPMPELFTEDQMRSYALAARASQPTPAQDAAATVPTGWKLVPVEPTPEMGAWSNTGVHWPIAERIYRAMLEAAPPAVQVTPTAVQPVAGQGCLTCGGRGLIGGFAGDGYDTQDCPDCAAPQAPALVPLTDAQVEAAVAAWFSFSDPKGFKFHERMRAAFAAAGITPAGTTPKEQQ